MKTTSSAAIPSPARSDEKPSALPPEEAWAAVLRRDPDADGRFVYAVSTTGIYCRPVCAARRPRREHVSFFVDAAAAEAAGYRACRRCRPEHGGTSSTAACVERALAYLDARLDETVTLEELGRAVYSSPFHLQRSFKRLLGVTPREYVRARRAERLKARLHQGDTVSRAAYEAGYGSGSRVYERSGAELGMTPAAYRRGGRGERIRYSTVASPLGWLLVARTERGVCAVSLGEDATELEAGLRREFPHAVLEHADDLGAWTEAVASYAHGATTRLDLPLDLRATAFQQRVWKALREIPAGETRSYGEIAAAVGVPRGARAVARACASNRVALAIPCHRVVREDGALGGYRWGLERKRRLLEQELEARERREPGAGSSAT
jgi:AraC family transcriptional regulator, regulatory protein of adaptative response / methylated-DNA-[protein]-cysteine methyltransferase